MVAFSFLLSGCQRGYKLDINRASNAIEQMISNYQSRRDEMIMEDGYTLVEGNITSTLHYSLNDFYVHESRVEVLEEEEPLEESSLSSSETPAITEELASDNISTESSSGSSSTISGSSSSGEKKVLTKVQETWKYVDGLFFYELSYEKNGNEEAIATGTKTPVAQYGLGIVQSIVNDKSAILWDMVLDELESAKGEIESSNEEDLELYSSKEGDLRGKIGLTSNYIRYNFEAYLPVSISHYEEWEDVKSIGFTYGRYTRDIPNLNDFEIEDLSEATEETV